VLIAIAIAAVVAGIWGSSAPSRLSNGPGDFYSNGSESVRAQQELESARDKGSLGPPNLAVLVRGEPGTGVQMWQRLQGMPEVAEVHSNILTGRDNRSSLLLAWLRKGSPEGDLAAEVARELEPQRGVLVGGTALARWQFADVVKHDLLRGEMIALPLLIILGLWVFRSLIAALLPVAVGGFALLCTLGCLRLATEISPISIFCLNIASALALGLAVDYSLLMVSRFRDELALGRDRHEAVLTTVRTTGRTVAISSATIAASFACLFLIPVPFVRSIAVAGMLVAFIAGIGALAILPALFSLLGKRVDALPLRVGSYSRVRQPRAGEEGGWRRLAGFVMRRPVLIASATALLLIGMSLPALNMRFTAFDATSLPASSSLRVFSEELQSEFEFPMIGEIRIAVHGTEKEALAVRKRVERVADRAGTAQPFPLIFELGPRLYEMRLNPTVSPYSGPVRELIEDLRRLDAPIAVGGNIAGYADLTDALKRHLPAMLLALVLVSFFFLFLATRSLVLPLKALIMNVLSLGAAFGLLVALFQAGRLEGLLGYSSQDALVVVLPVVLGVGAFGLLTDYGLFLLMRIKEARDGGHADREAIVLGLEKTGPVVTAAALMFSVAVGAFVTSDVVLVKEVALGIVTAVLLDAFVIRPLLVPSLMAILGHWNWWPQKPGLERDGAGDEPAPSIARQQG
jgi:uncharacterized membrane protein YdfJ with MMPL/SSD domain